MAGNVPLQALVTLGVKPLNGVQLVTECEPVTTRSGTPLLLLRRCRQVTAEGTDAGAGHGAGTRHEDQLVTDAAQHAFGLVDQQELQVGNMLLVYAPARCGASTQYGDSGGPSSPSVYHAHLTTSNSPSPCCNSGFTLVFRNHSRRLRQKAPTSCTRSAPRCSSTAAW
jgi:hypothetical protein